MIYGLFRSFVLVCFSLILVSAFSYGGKKLNLRYTLKGKFVAFCLSLVT